MLATGGEPDLITLGKPMASGFPVGSVLGSSKVIDPFVEETGYFSTFGGNALASAAAPAVLQAIEDERLLEHVTGVSGEPRVLALGATKLAGEDVYADPAGHPFCLIRRPGWAPPVPTDG